MNNRSLALTSLALIALASSAGAQQRRSAGPAPEPRVVVEPQPRRPFIGSWMGSMKLAGDNVPISVDIIADGEGYRTMFYTPNGAKHPTAGTEMVNGVVRWKVPNNGGGVWVYEATRIQGDTIVGKVALTDGPPGLPANATLTLVRMRP